MSAALLAKLKIKKTPKMQESIIVALPAAIEQLKDPTKAKTKENIQVKIKILDKRKMADFDRDLFMKKIKESQITKIQETKPPTTKPESIKIKIKPKKLKEKISLTDGTTPVVEEIISLTDGTTPAVKEKLVINIKPKKRRTKKPPIGVIQEGTVSSLVIGDTDIGSRLGAKPEDTRIKAGSYYMNNREIFINFMTSLFGKYKSELELSNETCDRNDDDEFSPMAHQKIVRDYITLYTPYRGLLLFHGLGSGKTCSSVAIAEGMKTSKQIFIMTPASLRTNYIEELKKCGDGLYRKNQFWEFVNTTSTPEIIESLSSALSLPVEFIRRQGGVWLMNIKKRPNFKDLDATQKSSLDKQLDTMISYKYRFINYNGMRKTHLKALTLDGKKNPFDNSVVIIDEAHNFVSRIVNKLGREDTLSGDLYEYLMNASNAKVILLTGTPIINYPNEIAIMFNILRGKIKTWSFKLTINKDRKINKEFFEKIFKSTVLGGNIMDYIEYKPTSTTLVVTRNPFGFVNKTQKGAYAGVRIGDRGDIDDEGFVKIVTSLLKKNAITVNGVSINAFKALPDTLKGFKSYFIDDTNNLKNMNLFKRRIMGLSSYFRDMYSLMPKYDKNENFRIIKINMSDFQFGVYEEARVQERKLELRNARKRKKTGPDIFDDSVSTYRIFSRAFCNFVFPAPDIKRPLPNKGEDLQTAILDETADEDLLDAASAEERKNNVDGRFEADELKETQNMTNYEDRIKEVLKLLESNKEKYLNPKGLEIYSPKFLNILENVSDEDFKGLHLIYSQFRTLEGIGIMKLVFEANGYAQFKIAKKDERWVIDIAEKDIGKPKFALYTGTETAEEKEILRNIFNGTWKYIPVSLAEALEKQSSNNLYGEIVKVLMITASGAEGISLKNVRYVHITEPYWHPVRIQQVIGRARRICSHQELPEELRTVDVFLYLMTFSEAQLLSEKSTELRLKDKSKIKANTPVTSDEALYEIATLKEHITSQLLKSVKEASIDCALHTKSDDKEGLKCFTFGLVDSNKFSYQPSYDQEETDNVTDINKTKITWKAREIEIEGIKYAAAVDSNKNLTGEVFNLESYKRGEPVQVGNIKFIDKGRSFKYIPI
tara:strand:+ start:2365 stop:5694 length:3330 start_codon:yes stop_codon:yes gene_type:complete